MGRRIISGPPGNYLGGLLPVNCCCVFHILYALLTVWCLILVLMFIFRATVSAVSCLVVPAFICIDLLFKYSPGETLTEELIWQRVTGVAQ